MVLGEGGEFLGVEPVQNGVSVGFTQPEKELQLQLVHLPPAPRPRVSDCSSRSGHMASRRTWLGLARYHFLLLVLTSVPSLVPCLKRLLEVWARCQAATPTLDERNKNKSEDPQEMHPSVKEGLTSETGGQEVSPMVSGIAPCLSLFGIRCQETVEWDHEMWVGRLP